MIDTLILSVVTAAAIFGGLFSGVLGWLDSGEVFVGRKFASTALRAIVAGIIIAVGFNFSTIATNSDILLGALLAFLSGAGIDALGHSLAGAATVATTAPKPA